MQAAVIQNHENVNVRNIGQGEAQHKKYKRLNLVAVRDATDQMSNCCYILGQYKTSGKICCTKSGLTGLACTQTLCI